MNYAAKPTGCVGLYSVLRIILPEKIIIMMLEQSILFLKRKNSVIVCFQFLFHLYYAETLRFHTFTSPLFLANCFILVCLFAPNGFVTNFFCLY